MSFKRSKREKRQTKYHHIKIINHIAYIPLLIILKIYHQIKPNSGGLRNVLCVCFVWGFFLGGGEGIF